MENDREHTLSLVITTWEMKCQPWNWKCPFGGVGVDVPSLNDSAVRVPYPDWLDRKWRDRKCYMWKKRLTAWDKNRKWSNRSWLPDSLIPSLHNSSVIITIINTVAIISPVIAISIQIKENQRFETHRIGKKTERQRKILSPFSPSGVWRVSAWSIVSARESDYETPWEIFPHFCLQPADP